MIAFARVALHLFRSQLQDSEMRANGCGEIPGQADATRGKAAEPQLRVRVHGMPAGSTREAARSAPGVVRLLKPRGLDGPVLISEDGHLLRQICLPTRAGFLFQIIDNKHFSNRLSRINNLEALNWRLHVLAECIAGTERMARRLGRGQRSG